MNNKQDMDDLDKKVMNMFRVIAIEKYGFPKMLSNKSRDRWDKVLACVEVCKKTKAPFRIIKQAAINVIKDNREYLPAPIMFEGEILRLTRLELEQNKSVDADFDKGHEMSIARAKKRTEVVEKFGSRYMREMEQRYISMHPDKCIGEKGVLWGAHWEFYMALIRQDKDAADIIKSYEERINREGNRKCDT